jgi:alkaline phosphatase D
MIQLNRRAFFIVCLLVLNSCYTSWPTQPHESAGLSVLQGATDETSTQLNILAPSDKNYTMTISFDQSLLETPVPQIKAHPGSNFQIIQLHVKNLTSDLTYTLRIYEGKTLVDERFFRTLPKTWEQARVFVISCTSDSYDDLQKKQWKQIQEQKPDLLFLIGDNVYVDAGAISIKNVSEDDIWRRYVESAQRLDLYKAKQLTPVFATWDDHDFGINDGNSSFAHKVFSQKVFKTFFPMEQNTFLTSGPGVSSALKLGHQQFLFLDDRSFRTPLGKTPQSHFGSEQLTWLLEQIKNHSGPTWLISGDQFFGAYHRFESFEGNHPEDFKKFLKDLKLTKKNLVFLSGDRHLSEFMKIEKAVLGFETLEITSSGLHARMHPGSADQHKNKRRLFVKDGVSNYLDLKIEINNKQNMTFDAEVWGEDFASFFRQSFRLTKP